MKHCIPFVLVLGFLTSRLCADPPLNRLTQEEITGGWLTLFDGESTKGWRATSDANWKVKDGILSADSGQPGLLVCVAVYTDFALKADFRATPQTNSGIFLRTPEKPTNPAVDCYEVNIADESVSPFPTGSLVDRAKASTKVTTGEWHTMYMRAQGGRVRVWVDEDEVVDYTDPRPLRINHVALQYQSGPIEFRKIHIKPGGRGGD